METVTLGRTGLEVSRLGAGLVQIGSLDDAAEAGRVLNSALDAGISFLDTAECYGRSEEFIGRTVAHRRGEYVLATKAGHVADGHAGEPWTARTVADSIDRSLARMRTDHLDLVQLHAWDIARPPSDEVMQAVLDAKRAGKTRFVGYSQENEPAEWALRSGLFDTLQTAFSLVDQRARHGLFELAREQGVGIIAKRPIANTVWGMGTPLSGDAGDMVMELQRRAGVMRDIGPLPGAPDDPVAIALGFVLAHPEVDTAIVGTGDLAHMLSNIEIVENELPIAAEAVEELHRRFDLVGRDWRSIDSTTSFEPAPQPFSA